MGRKVFMEKLVLKLSFETFTAFFVLKKEKGHPKQRKQHEMRKDQTAWHSENNKKYVLPEYRMVGARGALEWRLEA